MINDARADTPSAESGEEVSLLMIATQNNWPVGTEVPRGRPQGQ